MFELLLTIMIAAIGLRAVVEVRRSPYFPWRRVVANLTAVVIFAGYSVLGLLLLLEAFPQAAFADTELAAASFVLVYLLWMGIGVYLLIRYGLRDKRRWGTDG